jgi:hypothetical protein
MCHGQLDAELNVLFESLFSSQKLKKIEMEWLVTGTRDPLLQSFFVKVKLGQGLGLLDRHTSATLLDMNSLRIKAAHRPAPFRLTRETVESFRAQLAPAIAKHVELQTRLVLANDRKHLKKHPTDADIQWYKSRTRPRVMLIQLFIVLSATISNKTLELKVHKSQPKP